MLSRASQLTTKLIGVDGCRAGWVLATSDPSLQTLAFSVQPALSEVIGGVAASDAIVAIDVPIGLAEDAARACDRAARRYLGFPRNCSVFAAPCRAALAATSYAEACRLNLEARGRGLSRQLYGILGKIREVDELITPAFQTRIREAHPEVTFAALAATGRGLRYPKKTPAGEAERLALLSRVFPAFDHRAVSEARQRLGPARVARDDLVDALACLATAYRLATGQALVLPLGGAVRDARGLRMEIVA